MADVMVLAPHPDDESIGCGGVICLHRRKGQSVHVVFLTSGELGLKDLPRAKAWEVREEEARRAAEVLRLTGLTFLRLSDWFLGDSVNEAANLLRPYLEREKPRLLYLPHPEEWHPDHSAALPIVRAALKNGGGIPLELRGYEVWTPLSQYDHVEDNYLGREAQTARCRLLRITDETVPLRSRGSRVKPIPGSLCCSFALC